MPTPSEMKGMSYFIAAAIKRQKKGEPAPTMDELSKKLEENIMSPNPLFYKLEARNDPHQK